LGDGVTIKRVRAVPWSRDLRAYERRNRIIAATTAALLLAVSVLCLVLAVETFWRTNGWAEATGTVIERHRSGDDDWDSTIRFEDSDGLVYTFRSEHGGAQGSAVTVKYPPRNPDRAQASADVNEDRFGAFVVGAVAVAGGAWAGVWSLGLVGHYKSWFEPDDSPPRTAAADAYPYTKWVRPDRLEKSRENWTRDQALKVERELNRVAGEFEPAGWQRRCRACGQPHAMRSVGSWRSRYRTERCVHCLWWHQVEKGSGGGG
jgi:hypothetical protein